MDRHAGRSLQRVQRRHDSVGAEHRLGRKHRLGREHPHGQGSRRRKEAVEMKDEVLENLEPIRFDAPAAVPRTDVVADWTSGLPVFTGKRMVLRELVKGDAMSLLSMLQTEEVA